MERVVSQVRGRESGSVERADPDGHVAAVEDDGQRVQTDANRRHLQSGDAPVPPEPDEDQQIVEDVEGTDRELLVDAPLPRAKGRDAQPEGKTKDPEPLEAQVGEAGESAPCQRSNQERQHY